MEYSQRAYRYIYLDAGHIAENLALAAASISCGSCHIGAFFDDEINLVVNIDGMEESAICLSVVGHLKILMAAFLIRKTLQRSLQLS